MVSKPTRESTALQRARAITRDERLKHEATKAQLRDVGMKLRELRDDLSAILVLVDSVAPPLRIESEAAWQKRLTRNVDELLGEKR